MRCHSRLQYLEEKKIAKGIVTSFAINSPRLFVGEGGSQI